MGIFSDDIKKFNAIYKLPVAAAPTLDVGVPFVERLLAFKSILGEELNEIDDIVKAVQENVQPLEILTMLADIFGDLIVYCTSESTKFGLPQDEALLAIMQSTRDDGTPIIERLTAFKRTLGEKLNKIDDIVKAAQENAPASDILTMLSGLLGELIIHCASEAAMFNLPQAEVLAIIMQSNFSKLDVDGNPIYDERGKVQKGPNYWKPEPQIRTLLESKIGKAMIEQLKTASALMKRE